MMRAETLTTLLMAVLMMSLANRAVGVTKMVTSTGASIDKVSLDIQDVFAGQTTSRRFNLEYSFRGESTSANFVLEMPSCLVSGRRMDRLELKIAGKSMFSSVDLLQSGFPVDVSIRTPSDTEGVLSCTSAELRELNTGTVIVEFQVVGYVRRLPKWQSSQGQELSQVYFSFDDLIAGKKADVDVDSRAVTVRLVDAVSYPASTMYLAPDGCKIGGHAISRGALVLKSGSLIIPDGGTLSIAHASSVTLALRIKSEARMGDKFGLIRCDSRGSLTYSY